MQIGGRISSEYVYSILHFLGLCGNSSVAFNWWKGRLWLWLLAVKLELFVADCVCGDFNPEPEYPGVGGGGVLPWES